MITVIRENEQGSRVGGKGFVQKVLQPRFDFGVDVLERLRKLSYHIQIVGIKNWPKGDDSCG